MSSNTLTRRRFISYSGVLISSALLPFGKIIFANENLVKQHLDRFIQLSEKLTGYSNLNAQLAARYLDAFISLYPQFIENLQVENEHEAQLSDLQKKILHAWYTGTVGPNEKNEVKVIAYKNALMYRPTEDGLPTPTYCFRGELWFSELPPGITTEPSFPSTF